MRKIANFVLQQFLSTLGVMVLAGCVTFSMSPLVRWFDPVFMPSRFLTETHYFTSQILVAVALGFYTARRVGTTCGLWVWVFPLVILSYAITSCSDAGLVSRFSRFFGTSCEPRERCFDQLAFTLPFYTSAAYSIGTLVGHRRICHEDGARRTYGSG